MPKDTRQDRTGLGAHPCATIGLLIGGIDIRRFPVGVIVGFTVVASIATTIASVTHLATYGPEDWGPTLSTVALALLPGVFVLFGTALIVLSLARVPLWPLLSNVPRPVIVAGAVAIGYIAVDFVVMVKLLPGQPEQDGAVYYFNEHGLRVPIDAHHYLQGLMHSARLFTGHEVWFLGLAAVIGYQLFRVRSGRLPIEVAPRDDALELHPLPAPLSRSLTLQTVLSPEQCSIRLLQPTQRPALALVGGYGMRGEATPSEFRLELGGAQSSLVYAVGRFEAAARPTVVRLLLTFKRWPLILLAITALLMPVWWLILNAIGIPFAWQGLLFVVAIGVGGNFVFGLAQMRSLLMQIKRAMDAEEVTTGTAPPIA